jgi:hypothetical protein
VLNVGWQVGMFVRPGERRRHVHRPTAGLGDRNHVRLQRIADHQESIGRDVMSPRIGNIAAVLWLTTSTSEAFSQS